MNFQAKQPNDFHNDDLDDVFGAPLREQPATAPAGYNGGIPEGKLYQRPEPKAFERPCDKCRGTGSFRSYTGRNVGPCFTCKGAGKIVTKTDTVKAKAGREAKAERTAAENLEAFKLAEPGVFAWFDGSTFPFAVAMREAVAKWGSLTERQLEASKGAMAKLEAAKVASVARIENAPAVNASALDEAFAKAASTGKRAPKLIVQGIKIYPAKAGSANEGALYVRGQTGYLGKIKAGRFMRSRECTDADQATVLEVIADPKAAAIKSGKLTTQCAVCGITLTDPASIEAGIGPICATKFGW